MTQRLVDEHTVTDYLIEIGLLGAGDPASVEPAGDGNINWVRRIRAADGRTWIVKQARAALEKFPQYAADPARLIYEARYLEIARPCDRSRVLPQVCHFDEPNRILVLEDIGDVPRMGESLRDGLDLGVALEELARFLARVHEATAGADLAARFANDQMRSLHGDHIFFLPFRPNDFDLDSPVAERAVAIRENAELVRCADRWYARYLEPAGALVHADVQSSNVLITDRGPVLLDAEIAHVGDPAFDLGTLVAHVYLPAVARCEIPRAHATAVKLLTAYDAERRLTPSFAESVDAYAAIEMIRRTIGAARIPAMMETAAALRCLDLAESALAGGSRLVR